jgi:hypothetical protein
MGSDWLWGLHWFEFLRCIRRDSRFAEAAEVCHIGIPITAFLVLQGVAADTLGFAATAPATQAECPVQ